MHIRYVINQHHYDKIKDYFHYKCLLLYLIKLNKGLPLWIQLFCSCSSQQ